MVLWLTLQTSKIYKGAPLDALPAASNVCIPAIAHVADDQDRSDRRPPEIELCTRSDAYLRPALFASAIDLKLPTKSYSRPSIVAETAYRCCFTFWTLQRKTQAGDFFEAFILLS